MKIKILAHYHGVQSKDIHLWPGETHDLQKDSAQNLIDRGFAEVVDEPKKPRSQKTDE